MGNLSINGPMGSLTVHTGAPDKQLLQVPPPQQVTTVLQKPPVVIFDDHNCVEEAPVDGQQYARINEDWEIVKGRPGPPGPVGPEGPQGASGSSINLFEYLFDTQTTAPPPAQSLNLNAATPALATIVWIINASTTGFDAHNILMRTENLDTLFIQAKADASRFYQYKVTGNAIDHGSYVEIPVQWDQGGAGANIPDTAAVFLGIQHAGTPGPVGPEGPEGPIGPQGPAGPQGIKGDTGDQGPIGPAGATGPQGPIGPTGATGPQGNPGNNGTDGAVGPAGPQGPQGPQGIQGIQGNTGSPGADGAQGPQGIQGPIGPQGPKGSDSPLNEAPVDGQQYARKDAAWSVVVPPSGGSGVWVGDTAPVDKAKYPLWWSSTTLQLFIWYDDGNTAQWVVTNPLPDSSGAVFVPEAPNDGIYYVRRNQGWVNGDNVFATDADVSGKVSKTGDVMSGGLEIKPAGDAALVLNKAVGTGTQVNTIQGYGKGVIRWQIQPGNGTAETGANVGSDFGIYRYDDAGAFLGTALTITRKDGTVSTGATLSVGNNLSVFGPDASLNNGNMGAFTSTAGERSYKFSADGWRWRWATASGDLTYTRYDGVVLATISAGGVLSAPTNYATHLCHGGSQANTKMVFTWAGQPGAPGWLWGGNDGTNMYVYQPGALTVNDSAHINGLGGWVYRNDGNNPAYLWCTEGDGQAQHLTTPWALRVNSAGYADNSGAVNGQVFNWANWGNAPAYLWCADNNGTAYLAYRPSVTVGRASRVDSVDGASGGTITSDVYNNGGWRSTYGFRSRAGIGGTETGNWMNFYWNGAGVAMFVDSSNLGVIQVTFSDERVKKDIEPLVSNRENYMKIAPVKYRINDIGIFRDDGVDKWGFSAQNLQPLVPVSVSGNLDAVDMKGDPIPATIDERPLLALTVLEVQALIREVTELRLRVAQLEGKA